MKRYWLISYFITSIAHAQLTPLQQSLNFEDIQASSFYIKSVTDPAQHNLALAEIKILEGNYNGALTTLASFKHSLVNIDTECQYWLLSAVASHKVQQFKQSDEAFGNAWQLLTRSKEKQRLLPSYNYWKTLILLERKQLGESARAAHAALKYFTKDSAAYYIKIGKLFLWLGGIKKEQEQLDSSEYYLQKSLRNFQNSPLDKNYEIIKVYNNLANVYAEEWNYTEATTYYERSIRLNEEKIRDYNELAITCSNLAVLHSKFENQLKSEYWFTQAFYWIKQVNIDPVRLSQIQQNYGTVLTQRFEIEKGLEAYSEALLTIEPFRQERIDIYAQILVNTAMSYVHLNQSEKADPIDAALDSIANNLKNHWPNEYERFLLWKVFKLMKESKFQEALQITDQLEQVHAPSEMDDRRADIREHRAICLTNLKRYQESIICYKEIYQYYLTNVPATHPLIISTLNNIGSNFYHLDKNDSATHYFERAKLNNLLPAAIVIPEESRFSSKIEWVVSNYYLLLIAKKSFQDGQIEFDQFKLSDGLILSTLSILDSKRIELTMEGDRINLIRLARDFFDVAIDYYYILSQREPAYINKAFLISEKAKYQALHKAIGLDKLNNFTQVAVKISDEERKLTGKVAQLEYQFAQEIAKNSEPIKELLQEYEQEWIHTSTRLNHLIDSIKEKLPDYYDLKFNKTTIDISTLRTDCLANKEQQVWVSYYVGDTTTYAIAITNTKTSFIKLGLSQEIKKQLKALNNYANLFSSHLEEIQIISGRLYDLLLAPVKATLSKNELKTKKIIIIPDDALNLLNFELLINSSSKTPLSYALYQNQFSYGFSSTLLWMTFGNKVNRKLEGTQLLGFAPEFESNGPVVNTRDGGAELYTSFGFQPLQKNQEEVMAISAIANKNKINSKIYMGKLADENALKNANLDEFDIIHFATHGFTNAGPNSATGIALARNSLSDEDDILFMDEIFNLKNNAHLVCLSACETARGLYKSGEGLLGLTRAFLYSGTRNLIVSLWKVDDEGTSSLMKDFYTELVDRRNISESLHEAKIKALKRNPNLPPAYWGAFIHIGLD